MADAADRHRVHMPTITWLHLSDLHFLASPDVESKELRDKLLHDIKDCIDEGGWQPNFVILSGDIAFSGQSEEYLNARQFLDRLLSTVQLEKDRLFIVPGNHDVDWGIDANLVDGVRTKLADRQATYRFLDNDQERVSLLPRFQNYQNFVNDYLDRDKSHPWFDSKSYYFVEHVEIDGVDVAILGLNSAWLSLPKQDRNHLILGERQVKSALEESKGADLRIAVMHHPFEWFRDFDLDVVEPLLTSECEFILHGHMHRHSFPCSRSSDTKATIISAGACYMNVKYPMSYNMISLDLGARIGTAILRTYTKKDLGSWVEDTYSGRDIDDGRYRFNLASLKLGKVTRKGFPWRLLFSIITVIAAIAALIWLFQEPGFEPFITVAGSFAGFVASELSDEKKRREASVASQRSVWRVLGSILITLIFLLALGWFVIKVVVPEDVAATHSAKERATAQAAATATHSAKETVTAQVAATATHSAKERATAQAAAMATQYAAETATAQAEATATHSAKERATAQTATMATQYAAETATAQAEATATHSAKERATAQAAATATGPAAGTETATSTATPTETATNTATPRWLPAPELLNPSQDKKFEGWNAVVGLEWLAVEGLREDEYYVVRISYEEAGNQDEFWRKGTSLKVPSHYSNASVRFPDYHYDWTVQVMRCTVNCDKVLDDQAKKEGIEAGDVSESWRFYWWPDRGAILPPTPTSDHIIPKPTSTPTPGSS